MNGGIHGPQCRNPCTCTLTVHVRDAAEHLMALPEYSYPSWMFGDRGNPTVSRFRHILFAAEDAMLTQSLDAIKAQYIKVRCLLYDGCLVEGNFDNAPPTVWRISIFLSGQTTSLTAPNIGLLRILECLLIGAQAVKVCVSLTPLSTPGARKHLATFANCAKPGPIPYAPPRRG